MNIKVGHLYRTNCGSIVATNEGASGSRVTIRGNVLRSGCRDSRCMLGERWNFDIEGGFWHSESHNPGFHLNIKEEIEK